jgi:Leucine-rich repeat (LRR) protein
MGNVNLDEYSDQQLIQRYALATLHFSTEGSFWIRNDGWLSDEDECTAWYPDFNENFYPFCDSVGRVANIELSAINMVGTLPPELSLLSDSLYRLNVRLNELAGTVPTEYGALSMMETLILSTNYLSGSMPGEISQWPELSHFDVSNNELHGQLPFYNWPLLNIYAVGTNEFSGSVPELVGTSLQLRFLSLSQNHLNGSIPTVVGNLQELTQLSLSHNAFTGLPSELGLLGGIRKLTIANCSTGGVTLPTELFSLANLSK